MVPPTGRVTHRSPAAVVGNLVDLGTAVEEGSPAAGEGLAGRLPAVGHTGHYLQGITAGYVSNMLTSIANTNTKDPY